MMGGLLLASAWAAAAAKAAPPPPHVLFVVGDDVGYSDFGYFNDQKTITPTIDGLLAEGIFLSVGHRPGPGCYIREPAGPSADALRCRITTPSRSARRRGPR